MPTPETNDPLPVTDARKRFGTVGALAVVFLCAGLCLLVPADAGAQSAIRGLHAERFDVALTLLADGSVDVRETVVFRFSDKTFSEVEREIPLRRVDGIIDVRASIDGRLLGGEGDERVRVRQGRRSLRVTWRFPKITEERRTFTLEYRAMGVLAIANGRASLAWTVLPSRHRYPIDEARVEWRVPESVLRVEPTTLDDPRWTSEALPDGWAATRTGLDLDETATLTDTFDASTLALAMPEWQTHADRARQMAPAFVIGALTLLVMAAGVVGMTWFRYHRPTADAAAAVPAGADTWPPAIGTALVKPWVGVGAMQVQAALLDLARRGVWQIAEKADDPRQFDVVMAEPHGAALPAQSGGVRPHEQVLIDAIWLRMKHGRLDLRTAWGHLVRTLPAFRRRLLEEMGEAGLLDAERQWAARGMRIAGIVITLLGTAGLAVFAVTFSHLGDLPLLVPGAVMASGVWFLIAGQVMSVLSSSGVMAAAEWRARERWLRGAVRSPMDAGEVARWFPVAAGFGLAARMLKAGSGDLAQGAAAFGWLGRVSQPGAALSVILAATSPSARGGGAGAGGAAGGGSSSAR